MDMDTVLNHLRDLHKGNSDLREFCAFPDDVATQTVVSRPMGARAYFEAEKGLLGDQYAATTSLLKQLGPRACWLDTYAGTNITERFTNKFGCYCLIGNNGFFRSNQMNAWMVYMPAGLYYPWHQHPAEEMYLCLAGTAVFKKDRARDKHMGAGGVTLHAANQPHAMETLDQPVLCYVVWRNEFFTKPVLTYSDAT
jgi:mannose-6-phosphate isomerase-like protein (cupin superfamily)